MRPYEAVIIFDIGFEDTAINAVLDRALEALRVRGANIGTVDRWGKRTLAYEIRHKRDGYYVLVEFTAEPVAAAELDRLLYLADEVMRHKIIRVPDAVAGRTRNKNVPAAVSAGDSKEG